MPTPHETIVRPVITEQTSSAFQERGEYNFQTSNQRGKERRVGQTAGRRPNWKKAIVTLREGDSIEIFEG